MSSGERGFPPREPRRRRRRRSAALGSSPSHPRLSSMRSVELTARGPFPSPRGSAPPSPREFFSPSSGAQLQQLQHQQRQQARADASVAGVVSSSDVPVPEKIRSVVARKAQAQPQPPAFPAPSWERISLPAATSEGQPSPVSLNRARLAELQRPQLRPQDSAQSTRLWVSPPPPSARENRLRLRAALRVWACGVRTAASCCLPASGHRREDSRSARAQTTRGVGVEACGAREDRARAEDYSQIR